MHCSTRSAAIHERRAFTADRPTFKGCALLLRAKRQTLHQCKSALPSSDTLPPTASLPQDLNTLTIPQLKEHLRLLKLPVSGRKAILIERLQSALPGSPTAFDSNNHSASSLSQQPDGDITSTDSSSRFEGGYTSVATRHRRTTARKRTPEQTAHQAQDSDPQLERGSVAASTSTATSEQPHASSSASQSSGSPSPLEALKSSVPQSSSQLSAEERQGVAAATRIATAVTVEALLEQMSLGDEGEDDDGNGGFRRLAVDTDAVAPWLKDAAAVVAATETAPSGHESRRTSAVATRGTEGLSQKAHTASLRVPQSRADQNGSLSGASGWQGSGAGAKRVFGSDISAAINRCSSVPELVSVVEAASATSPMFRIHCCAAIQRVARLAHKEPPSTSHQVQQLVGELSIQLLDQLHQCDVRSLSTLLWSFGRLGFQPVGQFQSAGRVRQLEAGYMVDSVVACLNMMDDFNWKKARPVDLVDILEGLVRLELNEPDLVAEVLRKLQSQMFRADGYCVSHALWASAKLPEAPSKEFLDAAARRFSRLCSEGRVRPFELTTALTGCVNLDFKDYRLFAAIKQQAAMMLNDMQPSEISMMCWALASLNDNDSSFMKRLIHHITTRLKPSQVPSRVVVNVMWSAARMDVHSLPLVEYTLSCLMPQVTDLPTSLLVQSLWSFAKMGHFSQKFLDAVGKQLVTRLDELDPHGISSMLWSYAHIGYHYAPLLTAAAAHVQQQKLTDWSPQQLALATWSLAIVEAGNVDLFRQLMAAAARCGPSAFTPAESAQIFQVYMKLQEWGSEYEGVSAFVENECTSLLAACQQAWRTNIEQNRYSSSRACFEIAGLLTALGYEVQVEQETEDGFMSVDVRIVDDKRKVALEVDGPSHFTTSIPRRSLGPSTSRSKSLAHRGWHVINVPLHELSNMKTSMERQNWLAQLLESADVKPKTVQARS